MTPDANFQVDPNDVLNVLRSTHPELVEAASWKVAAVQAQVQRDQALARVAELEGSTIGTGESATTTVPEE